MRRCLLIASNVAALALARPSLGGDHVVRTHRLDAALRVVGVAHWQLDGEVAGPVHVRPDGDVVALVSSAGRVHLVRWSPQGRELSRRMVDSRDEVMTSRLRRDGGLTVVTRAALLRIDGTEGKVVGRNALDFDTQEAVVEAAPNGAWFALSDRLVYVGLDGSRVEKALPLSVPEGPRNGLLSMLATDQDECLLVEQRVVSHEVRWRSHKPDHTNELTLTLLDPRGEVVARRTLGGRVRTRWEWFWHEPGTDGFLPKAFGLVRTRYEGWINVDALTERSGGDFLFIVSAYPTGDVSQETLVRMDHALRERWSRRFGGAAWDPTFSPPSAPGLLIHTGPGRLRSYDEQGGSEQAAFLTYSEGPDPSRMTGVAIGRDAWGRWIVAEHGEKSPGNR